MMSFWSWARSILSTNLRFSLRMPEPSSAVTRRLFTHRPEKNSFDGRYLSNSLCSEVITIPLIPPITKSPGAVPSDMHPGTMECSGKPFWTLKTRLRPEVLSIHDSPAFVPMRRLSSVVPHILPI